MCCDVLRGAPAQKTNDAGANDPGLLSCKTNPKRASPQGRAPCSAELERRYGISSARNCARQRPSHAPPPLPPAPPSPPSSPPPSLPPQRSSTTQTCSRSHAAIAARYSLQQRCVVGGGSGKQGGGRWSGHGERGLMSKDLLATRASQSHTERDRGRMDAHTETRVQASPPRAERSLPRTARCTCRCARASIARLDEGGRRATSTAAPAGSSSRRSSVRFCGPAPISSSSNILWFYEVVCAPHRRSACLGWYVYVDA